MALQEQITAYEETLKALVSRSYNLMAGIACLKSANNCLRLARHYIKKEGLHLPVGDDFYAVFKDDLTQLRTDILELMQTAREIYDTTNGEVDLFNYRPSHDRGSDADRELALERNFEAAENSALAHTSEMRSCLQDFREAQPEKGQFTFPRLAGQKLLVTFANAGFLRGLWDYNSYGHQDTHKDIKGPVPKSDWYALNDKQREELRIYTARQGNRKAPEANEELVRTYRLANIKGIGDLDSEDAKYGDDLILQHHYFSRVYRAFDIRGLNTA